MYNDAEEVKIYYEMKIPLSNYKEASIREKQQKFKKGTACYYIRGKIEHHEHGYSSAKIGQNAGMPKSEDFFCFYFAFYNYSVSLLITNLK